MENREINFDFCDKYVEQFEDVITQPRKTNSKKYYTGIDLGTACIVMAVLDEDYQPVAGAYQYADVVRDGMLVDYIGAVKIVKEMKGKIEESLGTELIYAAGAIPPGTDSIDGGAVKNVIQAAGFEITNMLDEPSAANMLLKIENGAVVDIGGGTTEIAVISLGGIVTAKSIRIGGDEFDESIVSYVKKEYNLMIGERTAEDVKIQIGSTFKDDSEETMQIRGRDLISGLPKTEHISSSQVRDALKEPVTSIVDAIKSTLEKTPPELSSDIMENGIMLTGGGALLRGLDKLVKEETGMPVHIAEDPLDCVALGTGKSVEDQEIFEKVLMMNSNRR